MDWMQCLTIIGTNIGVVAGFFLVSRKDMQLMDKNHREDMHAHKEDMQRMDDKWERLFSRFLELK